MASNIRTRPNRERAGATGISRRGFVGLVSASLVGQWIAEMPRMVWAEQKVVPMIPGFLRGSEALVNSEESLQALNHGGEPLYESIREAIPQELPLEIVSSADLGGEPFPSDSARIWVHGLLPPEHARLDQNVAFIDFEVVTEPEPGVGPYTHLAWTFERYPVINLSGPTSFTVPVGADSRTEFRISYRREDTFDVDDMVSHDLGLKRGTRPGVASPTISIPPFKQEYARSTELRAQDRFRKPRLRAGTYLFSLSTTANRALPVPANYDWLVPEYLLFLAVSVQPQ